MTIRVKRGTVHTTFTWKTEGPRSLRTLKYGSKIRISSSEMITVGLPEATLHRVMTPKEKCRNRRKRKP